MGTSCRVENVIFCLNAVETILSDLGMKVERGAAAAAAHKSYAAKPMF